MQLERHHANDRLVERAAEQLEGLLSDLVFVGGAIVNLLITDPAAPPVRPTQDVDLVVEVVSRLELTRLEEEVARRGFRPVQGAPVCRWRSASLTVDLMPTDPTILGFGNAWFREAVRTAREHTLGSGRTIRLVEAPVFVATKLEAFRSRGGRDLYGSHDLEDLIAVVDGRPGIVEEARESSEPLREYLSREIRGLLERDGFLDAVIGHLPQDAASRARAPILLRRLRGIMG